MAVDRNYVLNKMKGRMMTPQEFNFDLLQGPSLYSLLTPTDIGDLNKLATSIRYAGNPIMRLDRIDQIMRNRGFRKFTGGTNRVVYKFLEDDSFLLKVASDAVGVGDNPREWINQQHRKPFVTKVFEVSPCGTVGVFERVIPITSREEFLTIASDVFDVIRNWFIGEYVMDDIGSDYFLNWGVRKNFGPVLLDFPYSYKLDGNKLYCNIPNSNDPSIRCGGVIDYDDGFNHLRCTKCGAIYKAKELMKAVNNETVIIKGGKSNMKVSFGYGNDVRVNAEVKEIDTAPKFVSKKSKKKSVVGTLRVEGVGGKIKKINEVKKEIPKNDITIGVYGVNGEISNVKDLLPNGESLKCITVEDSPNHIMMHGNDMILITSLCGLPIENFVIFTKEASDALMKNLEESKESVDKLTKENKELKSMIEDANKLVESLTAEKENMNIVLAENKRLEEELEEANVSITSLRDDLEATRSVSEEMCDDYQNRIQNLLLEIEDLKKKRKTKTSRNEKGQFCKSTDVKETEEQESEDDIKNDIQDKEIVKKIDDIFQGKSIESTEDSNSTENPDKEDADESEKEKDNIPVGAAPPTNKQNSQNNNQRKSLKYDKSFYDKKKQGKKGKNR